MHSSNPFPPHIFSRLTAAESDNPEQVFTSFFESFDLEDTAAHLKEALSLVIEKRFPKREYTIEEDNVRFFYEKLSALVQAAYELQS